MLDWFGATGEDLVDHGDFVQVAVQSVKQIVILVEAWQVGVGTAVSM